MQLEDLRRKQGVYIIWVGDRAYVGSTNDLRTRYRRHLRDLINKRHINDFLQNAFNKSGSFKMNVVPCSRLTKRELRRLELIHMDRLIGMGVELLNIITKPDISGSSGYTHTKEAKQKMGVASKRNWRDSEYRAKMLKIMSGRNPMARKPSVDPHQALAAYRDCANLKETAIRLGKQGVRDPYTGLPPTKSAVWRALQKLAAGRRLTSKRARNREQSERRQQRLAGRNP